MTGDIEKYGTGFQRIRKAIKEYPTMKYVCRETQGGFLVELEYEKQKVANEDKVPDVPDKVPDVPDKVPDNLSENLKKIFIEIQKNKRVSMSDLSEVTGISKRKILNNTNKLKQMGLLERIGNNKTGYWQLSSNNLQT